MHDEPSPPLRDQLTSLGLSDRVIRAASRAARKMTGGAPLVDAAWLAALARTGQLTHFQAAEILAGRGASLTVGPYRVRQRIARLGYADVYTATDRESNASVWLAIAPRKTAQEIATDAEADSALAPTSLGEFESPHIARCIGSGIEDGAVWAAYSPSDGTCVRQWLARHGRIPAPAALEIARQLAAALAELEAIGVAHGDVSAACLWIGPSGRVQLTCLGLRAAVRPDETVSAEQLSIESLDHLAPERVTDASPPSIAADIFSFGCLVQQLLTGRASRSGGDAREKLNAIRRGDVPSFRKLVPDCDTVLADILARCLSNDPARRPASLAAISAELGASTPQGRSLLVGLIERNQSMVVRPPVHWRVRQTARRIAPSLVGAAACAVLIAVAAWPLWRPARAPRIAAAQQAAPAELSRTTPTRTGIPQQDSTPQQAQTVHVQNANAPSAPAANRARLPDAEAARAGAAQVAGEVRLAAYQDSTAPRDRLVLPADHAINAALLRLEPRTTYAAPEGQRATIATPPTGLVVDVEDVRFENVDFIWNHRAERITAPDQSAMIRQSATSASYVGCTFQASDPAPFPIPAAIRTVASRTTAALPPSREVRFERCVFRSVTAAVAHDAGGPASIALHNSLLLPRGAAVRMPSLPGFDAPLAVDLRHTTLRGAKSVVEFAGDQRASLPGRVSVEAVACVFSLESGGGLFAFQGQSPAEAAQHGKLAIEWSGEGSIAEHGTTVGAVRASGQSEPLPEELFTVEGLVAGKFEFAATPSDDGSTSRLTSWLAPLLGDQPPGVCEPLPMLPKLEQ